MPSKSKKQQRLFQMALAVRKGEMARKDAWKSVLSIVDGDMTNKQIEDFCVLENTCVMSFGDWCDQCNPYLDNVEKYELEIQFLENENNKTKDKEKIKKNKERIEQLRGMIQDNLALAFPNRDRMHGIAAEGVGSRTTAFPVNEGYDEVRDTLKKDAFKRAVDYEHEKFASAIDDFRARQAYLAEPADKLVEIVMGMKFDDRCLDYFYNEIDDGFYGASRNKSEELEHLVKSYDISAMDLLCNNGYYDYFDRYVIVIDDTVYSFKDEDNPFKNKKFAEIFVYKVWDLMSDDMESFLGKLGWRDERDGQENRRYLIKYYPENLVDHLLYMYDLWLEENS